MAAVKRRLSEQQPELPLLNEREIEVQQEVSAGGSCLFIFATTERRVVLTNKNLNVNEFLSQTEEFAKSKRAKTLSKMTQASFTAPGGSASEVSAI